MQTTSGNSLYFQYVETALGNFSLFADDKALCGLHFGPMDPPEQSRGANDVTAHAARELREYAAGERRDFTVPLSIQGTPFQRSVWKALQTIPYGETRSYKDIAAQLGNPAAVRAVGHANNRNPLPLLIPCHRVIGSDGNLVGYAGGLPLKESLLALEAAAKF